MVGREGVVVAVEAEAVSLLLPSPSSHMSGRVYYGCCVAMIVIVLRSDSYLQQTRDMEVALVPGLGSGTARQNDSLVVGEHAQPEIGVLLPRGGGALARAARPRGESQDEISLRGGHCGHFSAAESQNAAMWW